MKVLLFYASYLYFPFTAICILALLKGKKHVKLLGLITLIGTSLLAYARFVEPRILNVHHETIFTADTDATSPSIRLALFSDTHFGIFKNAMTMTRIVDKIQAQNPDAVFIAGDFLFHIDPADIPDTLAPLGGLSIPVYAVLGNHDVGKPGPIYSADLYKALQSLDVILVENRAFEVTLGGSELIVGGTSDLWERKQNFDFTVDLPNKPLILLTHNPDTAYAVPNEVPYSLMLAGHTHGGQVRLPWVLQSVIPTEFPFDKGLHNIETPGGSRLVYVTPGTGMVGLPIRFNMPPRIDILTVHLPKQ